MKQLDEETKNAFRWLLCEIWETFIYASLGYYDLIEDKLEAIVMFAKECGITEESMGLYSDAPKDSIEIFVNKFKK